MKHLSRDPEENRINKKRRFVKTILLFLLFITIAWAGFTVYEYTRVKHGKDTLICFNEKKEVEDDDEYSITCNGLLYKYRKYYYIQNDKLSAREFVMFFNDDGRD